MHEELRTRIEILEGRSQYYPETQSADDIDNAWKQLGERRVTLTESDIESVILTNGPKS